MLCISSIFLDGLIEILIGSHARLLVVYLLMLEVYTFCRARIQVIDRAFLITANLQ